MKQLQNAIIKAGETSETVDNTGSSQPHGMLRVYRAPGHTDWQVPLYQTGWPLPPGPGSTGHVFTRRGRSESAESERTMDGYARDVIMRRFPHELQTLTQWVGWKYENDPKNPDKPKKVPKNPRTGGNARPNDPTTWGIDARPPRIYYTDVKKPCETQLQVLHYHSPPLDTAP